MSIFQLIVGIIMVFGWRLLYPWIANKLSLITFLSLTALLLNALFSKIKAINIAFSLLETITLSLIIAGLLFTQDIWPKDSDNIPPEKNIIKRQILIFAGGLMALICFHNLADFEYLLNESNRETIGVLSPWGVFFTAAILLFTLCYSRNNQTFCIVNSSLFRVCILTSAIAFSVVLVLVALKLIPGNTDKVALGIGGVGFGNMSTNETSLLGCCLLLWVLQIQCVRGVSTISLACIPGPIIMVLLTQSRIGIGCVFIIVLFYLFYRSKYRLKELFISLFVIVLLSVPAVNVFLARMSADKGVLTGTDGGGIAGSGRALIWISYLDAFIEVASIRPLTWIVGVGPTGVVRLYDSTFLDFLGFEVAQGTYFPLHSDVVFTFLATGFLGLFLWLVLVTAAYIQIKRNGTNFCGVAAITVFVIFSLFDMLIYSTFSVWLLALAIAYPEKNQPYIESKI
ncbi:MAG: O-antigen ligase family protein [Desulfuromonadaceae bacterium]